MFQTRQRHHRQSRSEDSIRSHPMPHIVIIITTATMTIAPGYHHQQSHSVSGTTASSKPFCSLKRRFPWWAATTILYTHHRHPPSASQLYIILVQYFQPLAHPNLPSDNHRFFFHLVWVTSVELLRVRGAELWTVGELWGRRERLRLLGG